MKAVLFDLDGTLIDSAPDLHLALCNLLEQEGREHVPLLKTLPAISEGSASIISTGFSDFKNNEIKSLIPRYRQIYEDTNFKLTSLFIGIEKVLEYLKEKNIPYGIVTNKPTRLTTPIIKQIPLLNVECVVCGDTLEVSKPHPKPVEHAAKILNVSTNECIFVGDSHIDMLAGNAANCKTIGVTYGYGGNSDILSQYSPDAIVEDPLEIINWVEKWQS